MKHRLIPFLLAAALALSLSACGSGDPGEDPALTVAATTYPVYLFTTAITDGAEGVDVQLVVNQQVSCLHDYTLTIHDMKIIDRADVIILSGAGLEDFLSAALNASAAPFVDCSTGFALLPYEGHEDHDHQNHHDEDHYDPHFWLSRSGAETMLTNIAQGLSRLDPPNADLYAQNLASALEALPEPDLPELACPYLITFHDGFQYFAADCGLTILKAVEEEEGSEASAKDIREILSLIEDYRLPAIFTETNGSAATARAIARETGVEVCTLDMIMSGGGDGLQPYIDAMNANYRAIAQALGG